MPANDIEGFMLFARKKTIELLDTIESGGESAAMLGWRPGPGRAHIAWQLMHIAATDDRHLNVRMKGGEPANAEWVRRFAGGSTPDDQIPTAAEIRQYLTTQRDALLAHLKTLSEKDLDGKPNDKVPWIYRDWFQLLAWHEAHHQGQAHLTLNLYRSAKGK